jgi:CTP-dependent riboflavin kinase
MGIGCQQRFIYIEVKQISARGTHTATSSLRTLRYRSELTEVRRMVLANGAHMSVAQSGRSHVRATLTDGAHQLAF